MDVLEKKLSQVDETQVDQCQDLAKDILFLLSNESVSSLNENFIEKAFSFLKVCSRRKDQFPSLFSQKSLGLCMRYAEPVGAETATQKEALKLLINILHQHPEAPGWLEQESEGMDLLYKGLDQQRLSTDVSAGICFLYLRLLFLVCAYRSSFCSLLLKSHSDLPAILQELLAKWVPLFLKKDVSRPQSLGERPLDVVHEIFRCALTLVTQLSKYNPDCVKQHLSTFYQMLPFLKQLTEGSWTLSEDWLHEESTNMQWCPPWTSCIQFLVALTLVDHNSRLSNALFHKVQVGMPNQKSERVQYDNFANIFLVWCIALARRLDRGDLDADEKDELAQLLLLLIHLSQYDTAVRRHWKLLLLPDTMDRSQPLNVGSRAYNVMIRQLTACSSEQLKQLFGEFLWILCDEQAHRFVHYVSYGCAAGVLMLKNQLNLPECDDKAVDDQGMPLSLANLQHNVQNPSFDPMTGAMFSPGAHAAGDDMTEEEKEKENQRLLDLFDKLNRTGVVRVGLQPPSQN